MDPRFSGFIASDRTNYATPMPFVRVGVVTDGAMNRSNIEARRFVLLGLKKPTFSELRVDRNSRATQGADR